MKFTKRTAVGAVAGTVLAASAAYAFFSVTGVGSASASAAEVKPLEDIAATVAPMLPGASSAITFSVKNPNTFPIKLVSIERDGVITAAPGACQLGQVNGVLSGSTALSIPDDVVIAAGATNASVTVPGAIGLADTATQTCAISFPVKVTALQGN